MLTEFPWLGEFSYLKIISVMVLSTLNEKRKECGELPVAEGPVVHKMENVLYASSCFKKSGSYFFLISKYNLRNRWGLNPHQAWNQNRMDNQPPIAAVHELECFLTE